MARRLPPSAYVVPIPRGAGRRTAINPFGTDEKITWQIPDGGDENLLRAAQLQHRLALRFRTEITNSPWGTTSDLVAESDDLTYDRTRAVLAGDLWMRLDDITALSHQLGLHALFGSEARHD
ncbi:MAG: hypothetical protein O3A89_04710 [Actinomycetota bacterium]|nr:hypothetical protein [Actinomycetota bacterium]